MHISKIVRQAASVIAFCILGSISLLASDQGDIHRGYYRYPAIHGDTIIFTSEGDLWSVNTQGGSAKRLTSNTGTEFLATISPDGQTVAFRAEYEGPHEVYTMPVNGGLPQRRTWDGDVHPEGWTPDGRLMVSTLRYSTLPDPKLVLLDSQGGREIVPLSSAAQATYSSDGHTLFFTRWDWQGSSTMRYRGGTAESIWRYDGHTEATSLREFVFNGSRIPDPDPQMSID
jgi:tricorn protease